MPKGETIKDILARCPHKAAGVLRVTIFTSVWDVAAGLSLVLVTNPLTGATFTIEPDKAWDYAIVKARMHDASELKQLIHRAVQARGLADLPERKHATPVATTEQPALFA